MQFKNSQTMDGVIRRHSVGYFWVAVLILSLGPATASCQESSEDPIMVLTERIAKLEADAAKQAAKSDVAAAAAKSNANSNSPDLDTKFKDGLLFESPKKDYRFHVGALIQQDWAFFDQDEALKVAPGAGAGPSGGIGNLQDATFFRRGRIRFDGIAYNFIEWDFDCELIANNNVSFDDMWVGFTNLPVVGNLRAGHVKIPMGLESITSNRVFTFVERAAMFDAFLPEYGPGLLAFDSIHDGALTWATCLHRIDPNSNGTDAGDGQLNATMRLTSLLYKSADDRQYWHLGGAYSHRDDRAGVVRFRARPEWRDTTNTASLNNRFVDTGDLFADDYDLLQAETAWVHGPLSAQCEYLRAQVNDDNASPDFHGGYAMISYFLTGESRPYDKRLGRFARVRPRENFFLTRRKSGPCSACGFAPGAWELAARYSWVDLTSSPVLGGKMEACTFGVNWYLNYNLRVQANYVHTLRDADAPASISGDTDALVMRFSFDI